jgi:tetratricopeptide (TPR) repeat protein
MGGREPVTADAATLTTSHGGAAGGAVPAALAVAARDRYVLGKEVARGGGGRIIEAFDRALDRTVAIKVPLDASGAARLRDEADALARLQHPSIVPVYDVGVGDDGLPFFAMTLVGGRSLRDAIKEAATLEARLGLLPAVLAVAEAVAFAHARGVLHRDLKPGNVLVGEFGETLVIDWGLAVGIDHRAEGAIEGTPAYMPPEQARGDAVDERADVYALGAMLYHVLTGAAPYSNTDRRALDAVLAGAPEPIELSQPRAPRDLVAIAGKAMARDPAARYPSARQLADDLVRFQTGRLVSARRYSPVARARRWIGRHRAAVAIALTVALGGAAVTAAMLREPAQAVAGPTCPDARASLAGVWDDARRAALATTLAHASGSGDAAARHLDAYADRWVEMSSESCLATRVLHQQPESMFDARAICLAQRRDELAELLDVLATRPDLALRAPDMVLALQPIDDCGDVEVLRGLEPPPVAAEARAAIADVRRQLARAKARHAAGDYRTAHDLMAAVVPAARATGYRPVIAEALYRSARSATQVADYDGAEQALLEAILLGETSRHDHLVANAWATLIYVIAGSERGFERLDHWLPRARGAMARVGDPPADVAKLEAVVGLIDARRGRDDDAVAHWRTALALWNQLGTADSGYHAHVITSLGAVAHAAGDRAEAARLYEQSLAMIRTQKGARHPDQITALRNLSELDLEGGDVAAAAARCAEIRALIAASPPEPRNVVSAELYCVKVDVKRDPASAEAGLARLDALRPMLVAHHEATWRSRRGDLLRVLGRAEEALVEHRAALEVARARTGSSARHRVVDALGEIAEDLARLGRRAEAIAAAREAVTVAGAGEMSPAVVHAALLGLAQLGPPDAAELLTRAEGLERQHGAGITAPLVEARKRLAASSPAR